MNMATSESFGDHLLTCSICYEHFNKPKVLPCLHSFCFYCITRHHEIYRLRDRGKISCPTCRAVIPVPGNGITGFMNDGVVKRVKQLLKALPAIDFVNSNENVCPSVAAITATTTHAMGYDDTVADDDDDMSDDETRSRRREYTKPEDLSRLEGATAAGPRAVIQEIPEMKPDPPIVTEKRSMLRKQQSSLQDVIARMRNKMLELHHIENYIKAMAEKEIDYQDPTFGPRKQEGLEENQN